MCYSEHTDKTLRGSVSADPPSVFLFAERGEKMVHNDTLHLRLDSQLKGAIVQAASKTGESYSDITRAALALYLASQSKQLKRGMKK